MELGILIIIDELGIFMGLSITVGAELGTTCLSSELCHEVGLKINLGPFINVWQNTIRIKKKERQKSNS